MNLYNNKRNVWAPLAWICACDSSLKSPRLPYKKSWERVASLAPHVPAVRENVFLLVHKVLLNGDFVRPACKIMNI